MPEKKSSPAVLATLQWVLSRGYRPVPLAFGTKVMADRAALTANYIPQPERWQQENLNIGIVTGTLHKGPIDIDLDCLEAIRLAPYFLPATGAMFGRKSKANSHYLYEIENPSGEALKVDLIKLLDPTPAHLVQGNVTLLELRGDGSQTMLPGSIHDKSGETVQWSDNSFEFVVAKVRLEDLEYRCKMLAAACLIARYIWVDGMRHETVMQLAGIFQRQGKSREETENFISALQAYSGGDDPAHLATVRTTYARASNNRATQGARRLLSRFKDSNPAMIKRVLLWLGVDDSWVDEFNDKYATVLIGAKHRIVIRPNKQNDPLLFLGKEDFKDLLSGILVTLPNSSKPKPAADLWLQNQNRALYTKVEFHPGIDQFNMPEDTLNKFTGWNIKPEDNPSGCAAFCEMLEKYIANPNEPLETQWLYTFFAHILRQPMDKQRAACVIIGPQNIGKSVFVNYFGRILGRHHLNLADASKIHGRFNAHLEQCLLLHSEEAIYGQDKKHKSIIKDLISNKLISFEEKYLGVWTAPSYTRLIYTSNDDNAAPVELKDTRHSIFNLTQSNRIPPIELVQKLYEESISNGPAALMHYLLNFKDYAPKVLRDALQTTAKSVAIINSLEPIDEYWFDKLSSGEILPPELRWAQGKANNGGETTKEILWPEVFSRLALYADYIQYMQRLKFKPVGSCSFFRQLEKLIKPFELKFKRRAYTNKHSDDMFKPQWLREIYTGQHQTIFDFPSLEAARKSFNKYTGQKYIWNVNYPSTEEDQLPAGKIEDNPADY